ncbi:ferredoxin [Snodgrassella sp. CFCC 13594]|uniref:(2Fe-2S) ferredoxin domain-containing protein n=1 Tax=Snodgrassella sp. CFCC 13594 TaxID=1775559 RepID=UPI00082E7F26|nr:2Fe-2S ferredoxin [Snodgrassella sp. CFCC 13594]
MAYFQRHVFVCCNQRNDPSRQSCGDDEVGAGALDYIKGHAKKQGLIGPGKLRVSQSGCLGRCDEGPCLVIYPEGRWYTYVDDADLQEILDEDLAKGRPVERLLLDPLEEENSDVG